MAGAAALGAGTALGGGLTWWLYDASVPALITTVVIVQIAAAGIGVVAVVIRRRSC